MSGLSPEGGLRLTVHLAGGRVSGFAIASTRPMAAPRIALGRPPGEAARLLPRLYAVCAAAQGAAAALACARAAGATPDPTDLARLNREVAREAAREHLLALLVELPRVLGATPDGQALARLRPLLAGGGTAPPRDAALAELARTAVLGDQGDLAREAPLDWLERGGSPVAALVRQAGGGGEGMDAVPLLPAHEPAMLARALAQRALDEADFCRLPDWDGGPAQTGSLARRQADPAWAALLARGAGPLPRLLARVAELAETEHPGQDWAGSVELGPGRGAGWAHTARGLLLHFAQVADGRVRGYAALAPTEWNFHPRGALTRAARGLMGAGRAEAAARLPLLVHALDPCVAWELEWNDA